MSIRLMLGVNLLNAGHFLQLHNGRSTLSFENFKHLKCARFFKDYSHYIIIVILLYYTIIFLQWKKIYFIFQCEF